MDTSSVVSQHVMFFISTRKFFALFVFHHFSPNVVVVAAVAVIAIATASNQIKHQKCEAALLK